jgi:hypothetical protein
VSEDERLVTDVLAAIAALQSKLVHKVVELGREFPDATPTQRIDRLDLFDNAAHRAIRERHGLSEERHLAQGGFEGVAVTGSIDAHLPDTQGVVWDITLARHGRGWVIHRWLYAYLDADRSEYFEGRREVAADFPEVEVPDSRELVRVLPRLTEELLSAPIPRD